MLLKPADFWILIPALGAVIVSFFVVYAGGKNTNAVYIQGGDGVWVFPLDAHETVSVPGPLGATLIEVRDGGAYIVSSPCTNQTCVASGRIHSRGQWTACLPNQVMVYIDGDAPGEEAGRAHGTGVDAAAW